MHLAELTDAMVITPQPFWLCLRGGALGRIITSKGLRSCSTFTICFPATETELT